MKGHLPKRSNPLYCVTKSIEIYMQEVREFESEFDALCLEYDLPKRGYNYVSLLTIYVNRRNGGFPTDVEILSDFTALDIARMLKQLSFSKGAFSLAVGGLSKDYDNPKLVEVLKKSLADALAERVEKMNSNGVNYMILYKAIGRRRRGFSLPYPAGCSPQEVGFSNEELNAIIDFELGHMAEVEKMKGNKERWESDGSSRLPELGRLAEMIMEYLPKDWPKVDQLNFVFDFLFKAGFLDFKSEDWKAQFSGIVKSRIRKMKDRMVRNWVSSYHKSKEVAK